MEPIWFENTQIGMLYMVGDRVVATIVRLAPYEWAWDVLHYPNAASRTSTKPAAIAAVEAAWKEHNP